MWFYFNWNNNGVVCKMINGKEQISWEVGVSTILVLMLGIIMLWTIYFKV